MRTKNSCCESHPNAIEYIMAIVYVQFPSDSTKSPDSKSMPVPKRVGDIMAWFKDARKVLPQIPDPTREVGVWRIKHMEADLKEVRFVLADHMGQVCIVVIDRTKKF